MYLSGFYEWKDRDHADKWLLFEENMGPYLSIDETSLSDDELYTIVTNKEAKGRKGSIVAIVRGTKAEDVIEVLLRIKKGLRHKVKEVTLDMADSELLFWQSLTSDRSFPCSKVSLRCFTGYEDCSSLAGY